LTAIEVGAEKASRWLMLERFEFYGFFAAASWVTDFVASNETLGDLFRN
jgi:hypothetical protein